MQIVNLQTEASKITQGIDIHQQIELDCIQWVFMVLIFYFSAIAINYLTFAIWGIIKSVWPEVDLYKRYSSAQKQTWAVVTGATDGIGLGFCQQLVTRGFNVCVISRNSQKINNVVKKLQSMRPEKYKNRKVIGIQFDFTQIQDEKKFNKLWSQLQQLDIGILVNNVGKITYPKRYQDCEYKQVVDLINVNCVTMASVNARMVKKMKERKQKSAIINLSSFAGLSPIPYVTLYSASKAFNRFLSEGISIESPELDVLAITPMYVESAGSRVKKQFNIPTSRQCAKQSLKQLRFGSFRSFGYPTHKVLGTALMTFLPKWVLRIVSNVQMKRVVNKRYSKKKIN